MRYLFELEKGKSASGDKPSTSPVYRNVAAKDNWPGEAPADDQDVQTLYASFMKSVKLYGPRNCIGYRETDANGNASDYKWITYSGLAKKAEDCGSALVKHGIQPNGRVGIFGINCCEWMIAMQACNRQSLQCVPLYDTLGENAIEYIVNHSEATVVFASAAKLPNLIKALPKCPNLKTVIVWGKVEAGKLDEVRKFVPDTVAFEDFLAEGGFHPAPAVPPKRDDLCTIMYTSGTTGDPKGVMLTHWTVLSCIRSVNLFLDQAKFSIDKTDVMLSYLPLAHIMDRTAEEQFLSVGASIGYWQGDINKLVDDINALKPTIFFGVPRVFDRVYQRAMSTIEATGGLKKFLFNWGFSRKKHFLAQGYTNEKASPFFDKLVFSKTKARLGGRVRLIVSGSAPLARHVEDFLNVCMCAPVVQGYGLTETCAASCIAMPNDYDFCGTVGSCLPGIEFRLESVPEMGYDATANPPRGEVCFRGPIVFSGYYKDPQQTQEAMDADGFFHTGDVAELTPEGALRIIDRKKNIFKLSQGEYVAVEKLENTYKQCTACDQVWVYGNSLESFLVSVVVPNKDKIEAWAKGAGVSGSYEELCKHPKAAEWVLEELQKTGRAGKLKGFEIVKAVHLDHVPFSVERDLMTPSFKLRRPQLKKAYEAEINAMYQVVNAAEKAKENAKNAK